MLALGCLVPVVLTMVGAALGAYFGGAHGGLLGVLAGLVGGVVITLAGLWTLDRARDGR
jgi:putative Mn2+ efflux pump MntP